MKQFHSYQIGDRVSLALKGAYGASQWTGALGTVEHITFRDGSNPLYRAVLDQPIIDPSPFFSKISADGLRDDFAPQWLEPASVQEESISIASLADIL